MAGTPQYFVMVIKDLHLATCSLLQPWASGVIKELKQYETRSKATSYRGPLFIHASGHVKPVDRTRFLSSFGLDEPLGRQPYPLPLGEIIGIVSLVNCEPTDIVQARLLEAGNHRELCFGDYSSGRFAWKLDKVIAFDTPVPYSGYQCLWNPIPARVKATDILCLALQLEKKIERWPAAYTAVLTTLNRAYEILRKNPDGLPRYKKKMPGPAAATPTGKESGPALHVGGLPGPDRMDTFITHAKIQ